MLNISKSSSNILFFVDSDNSADLIPKYIIPFLETNEGGHVLSYACQSVRTHLFPKYQHPPLNIFATLMPGPGSGKNAVDTILARDLGILHILCKIDVIFFIISRDKFDLSEVWFGLDQKRIFHFADNIRILLNLLNNIKRLNKNY